MNKRGEEEEEEVMTAAQEESEEEEEEAVDADNDKDDDDDEEDEEEEDEDDEDDEDVSADNQEPRDKDDDVGSGDCDDDGVPALKKKKTKQKGGKVDSSSDKKCVPGIIYLGHIPPRLKPKHIRNLLAVYGEIGRVFLQPEDHRLRARKKKSGLRRCDFTEGWVEFRSKRVAKRVALSLHNTPMATRKRQHFASDLWCIKYLHRFQWTHLSERLAYEQTVLHQRLRTEVSQAKKETNFYLSNVDKSAHLDKLKKKRKREGEGVQEKAWDFTQRQTEEEIQKKKSQKQLKKQLDKAQLIQQKSQSNVSLLAKIFNSNQS